MATKSGPLLAVVLLLATAVFSVSGCVGEEDEGVFQQEEEEEED